MTPFCPVCSAPDKTDEHHCDKPHHFLPTFIRKIIVNRALFLCQVQQNIYLKTADEICLEIIEHLLAVFQVIPSKNIDFFNSMAPPWTTSVVAR